MTALLRLLCIFGLHRWVSRSQLRWGRMFSEPKRCSRCRKERFEALKVEPLTTPGGAQ